MPTDCSADRLEFARIESCAVVASLDGGTITSDAGALLLGATDRAIGLVRRFVACFTDHRAPDRIEHGVATLVGQRVFAQLVRWQQRDLVAVDDEITLLERVSARDPQLEQHIVANPDEHESRLIYGDWLQAQGRSPLYVGVWSENLGAQRFYAPDDSNAADNLFVFAFANFGVASIAYLALIVWVSATARVRQRSSLLVLKRTCAVEPVGLYGSSSASIGRWPRKRCCDLLAPESTTPAT